MFLRGLVGQITVLNSSGGDFMHVRVAIIVSIAMGLAKKLEIVGLLLFPMPIATSSWSTS